MVSSGALLSAYSPTSHLIDKDAPSSSSLFQEELEIARSMRNAKIIDHDCEPANNRDCVTLNVFYPIDADSHSNMIHIDVPDTQTLVEKSDGTSKYVAYNIYINGWFHSRVRFSHLLEFADILKHKFGHKYKGPEFPPKKLLKLDSKAVDERRQKICKYFQAVVQHPEIARHYYVEKKFLDFQIDSFRATSNYVTIDVFLGDGEKILIKCNISDSTNDVMKMIAEKLGFSNSDKFIWNFGLFMGRTRDNSTPTYSISPDNFDPIVIRLLKNFEAPYISLSTSNQRFAADGVYHILVIRKLIWDPRAEEPLLDDRLFVNLLYRQASQDYRNGHITGVKDEAEVKLRTIIEKGERSDEAMFIRSCHLIPSYSYEILSDCISDFPRPNTRAGVKFGRRQMVLTYKDENGKRAQSIFRATRIRIWRITQVLEKVSFQFEYLMARDSFEWITLQTDQAILMSQLLQSIGAEILYEHNSLSVEQQILKEKSSKGMLVEKDESEIVPRDPKKPIIVLKNAVEGNNPLDALKNIQSARKMKTTISEEIPQKNEAFSNITDEDL
ncbi:unnamed protein product [Caenorhabditis bovis]|uniref:PX domain-containing protein n=1 Tax=Caenorhabditis bovis TaxID=2654633 RepID=A0A8S1EKJ7_9PELO|nr:unnamed protein product [Caenorhabditis bovis]